MANKKNNIILKIIYTFFYYCFIYCFWILNPFFITISSYSNFLLVLLILVLPILLVLFPIILSILSKVFNINISNFKYSFIALILYVFIIAIVGYYTDSYFKNFSYKKWNNSDYCDIRYMMVDSLKSKYNFYGMDKNSLYSILGKPNNNICKYDYENDDKVCYMIDEDSLYERSFICFYFDDNVINKIEDN